MFSAGIFYHHFVPIKRSKRKVFVKGSGRKYWLLETAKFLGTKDVNEPIMSQFMLIIFPFQEVFLKIFYKNIETEIKKVIIKF